MAHRGRKNADEVLAVALAAGKTVREAADLAGIAERTVARRVTEPAFVERVAQLRGEMTDRAVGRLADSMTGAAATMRKLLGSRSDVVRLGAARAIMELGCKLRESSELAERVAALERIANEINRPRIAG